MLSPPPLDFPYDGPRSENKVHKGNYITTCNDIIIIYLMN